MDDDAPLTPCAIKLVAEYHGAHVTARVFVGPDMDHLALTGQLRMDPAQWETVRTGIMMAAVVSRGAIAVRDENCITALKQAAAALNPPKVPR